MTKDPIDCSSHVPTGMLHGTMTVFGRKLFIGNFQPDLWDVCIADSCSYNPNVSRSMRRLILETVSRPTVSTSRSRLGLETKHIGRVLISVSRTPILVQNMKISNSINSNQHIGSHLFYPHVSEYDGPNDLDVWTVWYCRFELKCGFPVLRSCSSDDRD